MTEKCRLYVAGPSSELDRVEHVVACLERTNLFTFTLRWWEGARAWSGRDRLLAPSEQLSRAAACFDGIRRAAIFIGLFQSFGQRSSVEGEITYAIAQAEIRDLFTICTGRYYGDSILTSHARVRAASDDVGIDTACRIARELTGVRAAAGGAR